MGVKEILTLVTEPDMFMVKYLCLLFHLGEVFFLAFVITRCAWTHALTYSLALSAHLKEFSEQFERISLNS